MSDMRKFVCFVALEIVARNEKIAEAKARRYMTDAEYRSRQQVLHSEYDDAEVKQLEFAVREA